MAEAEVFEAKVFYKLEATKAEGVSDTIFSTLMSRTRYRNIATLEAAIQFAQQCYNASSSGYPIVQQVCVIRVEESIAYATPRARQL